MNAICKRLNPKVSLSPEVTIVDLTDPCKQTLRLYPLCCAKGEICYPPKKVTKPSIIPDPSRSSAPYPRWPKFNDRDAQMSKMSPVAWRKLARLRLDTKSEGLKDLRSSALTRWWKKKHMRNAGPRIPHLAHQILILSALNSFLALLPYSQSQGFYS